MPGNNIYVKGSYVDIHDNENVYLSIDKAEVKTQTSDEAKKTATTKPSTDHKGQEMKEEPFKFIHPAITGEEELKIHEQVKKLVTRQGIQEICQYLTKLVSGEKIYLPQSAETAYAELVRMGMPDGEGFSKKTFMKYYRK